MEQQNPFLKELLASSGGGPDAGFPFLSLLRTARTLAGQSFIGAACDPASSFLLNERTVCNSQVEVRLWPGSRMLLDTQL